MADVFYCELTSPAKKVFSGNVSSVLVSGYDGYFEVLPRHAFITTMLKPGYLVILQEDQKNVYFISAGYADVKEGKLSILGENIIPQSEMSEEKLTTYQEKVKAAFEKEKDIEKKQLLARMLQAYNSIENLPV